MESEMIQVLQTIADNIQAASQPGWVECLSIVISSISVVISGVAIWFAIRVPKEIAIRQIKVQTYAYKIEYMRMLYELEDKMQALQSVFTLINLDKESFHRSYERYTKLNIQYLEIMMALKYSKNVFTQESWELLKHVRKEFKVIHDTYAKFNLYASVLSETEQKEREIERKDGLHTIQKTLGDIIYNLNRLLEIVEKDTVISDIHSML